MHTDGPVDFRNDYDLHIPPIELSNTDVEERQPSKRGHEEWHCEDPECPLGCTKVRRKLEFPEVSPTVPYTVQDSSQEESQPLADVLFGPQLPSAQEYININALLPADSFVGRYPKGITIDQILLDEGYDPRGLVFNTLTGCCIPNDEPILQDTTIVAISDLSQHVQRASKMVHGIFSDEWTKPHPDNAMNLIISHQGTVFWKGIIQSTLSLYAIDDAIRKSLRCCGISLDLRWTCRFTPLNHEWGWKLCDLTNSGD